MSNVIKEKVLGDLPGRVCPYEVDNIEVLARRILDDAERRARELVADAERRAREVEVEARRRGYQDGHQEGLKQGLQAGREQGRAEALEQFTVRGQQLQQALQQLLEDWSNRKQRLLWQAEQELIGLAVAIAERVVKKAGLMHPEVAVENVRSAAALVATRTDLLVYVNPRDAELMRTFAPQLAEGFSNVKSVHVLEDESIEPGGCRLQTPDGGQIDARLQTQLERVADELLMGRQEQST